MRVAQIKTVKYHPDADSLYVEEIDTGEECYRNVVTGLVKHVPIDQVFKLLFLIFYSCERATAFLRRGHILEREWLRCLNGHSGWKCFCSIFYQKNLAGLKTNFTKFELSTTFRSQDTTH